MDPAPQSHGLPSLGEKLARFLGFFWDFFFFFCGGGGGGGFRGFRV